MPNHITSRIIVTDGPEKEKVIDALIDPKDKTVDFNKIIPMPEILRAENSTPSLVELAKIALGVVKVHELLSTFRSAPNGEGRVKLFKEGNYGELSNILETSNILRMLAEGPMAKDLSNEDFDLFVKYMRAYRQTKTFSWYDWAIENWGTKWNAYSSERKSAIEVWFQTAWSMPLPVVNKLSLMFPENTFRLSWADEDTGSNAGDIIIQNGKCNKDAFPNGSIEAFEIAFELTPDRKQYYELKNGTYEYVEETVGGQHDTDS
jgi:hypothetical protein